MSSRESKDHAGTDYDARRRWGLPVQAQQLDDEVAEELAFHLEQRQRRLEADGRREADARDEAVRRFGNVAAIHEQCLALSQRAEKTRMRIQFIQEFFGDVKLALRGLRRRPAFAISAILTLALGIGATTAMYSLLDAVFLRALPYDQPERLTSVWQNAAPEAQLVGFGELEEFENVAAYAADYITLTGGDEPARLAMAQVSSNFFETLRVQPLLGRGFLAQDAEPRAADTVVLSEEFWRERFQGQRDVIDQTIRLNGRPHQIIGVMPARLDLPNAETQVWTAFRLSNPGFGFHWGNSYLSLFARLADGVSLEQAQVAARTKAEQLRLENPIWRPDESFVDAVSVKPFQRSLAGGVGDLIRLLFFGVLAVLLVVCVNVASLFISKGKALEQESAIRASLGAGRVRLIGQSLVEAWVIALLGTGTGVVLAFALLRWLPAALPGLDGQFGSVGIDVRVLAFSLGLSILTALVFGLVPALRGSRTKQLALAVRGQRGATGADRTGPTLVVAQLALTTMLLTGAGLLAGGVMEKLSVETGLDGERLVAAALHPATEDFREPALRVDLYRRVIEELERSAVIESAAASTTLPFGTSYGTVFEIPHLDFDPNDLPYGPYRHVTPGYFATMGVPILRGRDLQWADELTEEGCTEENRCAALINQAMVDRFFPNEDPLGRTIGISFQGWYDIVGVVGNVPEGIDDDGNNPTVYFPQNQRPQIALNLVVKSRAAAPEIQAEIERAVSAVNAQVPVTDVRTLQDDLWGQIATSRLAATLIGAFALAALLLAAVGIYGVMSYRAQQRRREMGIRLALGSTSSALRTRELARVVRIAVIGLVLGGGLSFAALRFLGATELLQTAGASSAASPGLWLLVGLVLVAVAVAAGYGPARRASTLDPVDVLGVD